MEKKTIKNSDGLETVFEYWGNDNLMTERNYLNDKRYGISRLYYMSGNLHAEWNYLNDIRVGQIVWYEDGIQSSELKYDENGNYHGKCIDLYENGNVRHITTYNHGNVIEEKSFSMFTGEG